MKISYRPLVRIDLIEAKSYYNLINADLSNEARNRIVILAVVFAGKDFIDFTKR